MKMFRQIFLATAFSLLSFNALAATVGLDPSSLAVNENGNVSIDIVIDATDAPGTQPGLIQGNIAITWDSALAQYDGFSFVDSEVLSGPTLSDGRLDLGFTNGAAVGTIGTLEFTITGLEGDMVSFGLSNQFGFSTFVNLLPVNTLFDPALTGTEITVVPIPAAAWLMLSALGVLGGVARRRAAA